MATVIDRKINKKIGLLGGSFNPAHNGHILISKTAMEKLGLDEIWWLVTPQNPQKINMTIAPIDVRIDYANSIIGNNITEDSFIKVKDVETDLKSTYTIDVINHLTGQNPNYKFIWLMGGDNLVSFTTWHKWEEIIKKVHIAVFSRPNLEQDALQGKASCAMKAWKFNFKDTTTFIDSPLPQWAYIDSTNAIESATQYRSENGEQWWLKDK